MYSPKFSFRKQIKRRPAPVDQEIPTLTKELEKRLKAVVICFSNSWGGLEQIAASDTIDLAELGLKVKLLCVEGTPIEKFFRDQDLVEIIKLEEFPRNYFDLKLRKILLDLHQNEGVNLFHTHQPSLLGSIIPWFWNNPNVIILASRHILNAHNKKNPFHALVIYRRLDALIVMSQAMKENVLRTHPLKDRQLRVIHLGLDFNQFDLKKVEYQSQRAQWGADSDTVVVGLVGRIDPDKGQDVFIKAAAHFFKSTQSPDQKIKFLIVGEETKGSKGEYLESLQRLVKELHLSEHVMFTGFQKDIPKVMRALDVTVMPSRQEAFGLVAIEAMAMECPVVISRGGSADEIVGENEEFGLLVRPFDAFDLSGKLSLLVSDPEMRKKMGKNARKHVLKNYNHTIRLQRTLSLYERMLRRQGL